MKTTIMILVGKSAPNNNFKGDTPPSKYLLRILWPAGLGALAITVRPPPVTAPATTAYCNALAYSASAANLWSNAGTCDARKVIAALSLNAVNKVEPINNGISPSIERTGAIHQPCRPPCVTRPAKKKPTSKGPFKEIAYWW